MTIATSIARKTNAALIVFEATQTFAGTLALDSSTSSSQWMDFAIRIADAEGCYAAWARMSAAVAYAESHDVPVDEALVLRTSLDLLARGADDSWSGRNNDSKRAHHDGVLRACNDMKWL